MPNLDIFIKNILHLRKKHKLSQEEFAKILNVKRSVIGAYEQRVANPSIESLMVIHEHFKIDIHKLLYEPLEMTESFEDGDKIGYMYEMINLTKKMNEVYNKINQLREKIQ